MRRRFSPITTPQLAAAALETAPGAEPAREVPTAQCARVTLAGGVRTARCCLLLGRTIVSTTAAAGLHLCPLFAVRANLSFSVSVSLDPSRSLFFSEPRPKARAFFLMARLLRSQRCMHGEQHLPLRSRLVRLLLRSWRGRWCPPAVRVQLLRPRPVCQRHHTVLRMRSWMGRRLLREVFGGPCGSRFNVCHASGNSFQWHGSQRELRRKLRWARGVRGRNLPLLTCVCRPELRNAADRGRQRRGWLARRIMPCGLQVSLLFETHGGGCGALACVLAAGTGGSDALRVLHAR